MAAAIKVVADFAKKIGAAKLFDAGDVQANGFQIVEDDRTGDTFTETGASYMGFSASGLLASGIADKPRYTMGLGTPPQLLKMVALGVDMFDCVLPSRVARNGLVFTPDGPMNLRNEKYRTDAKPIVESGEGSGNYTARFSRAYLRHLTVAGEILSCTLLTLHNLSFDLDLMASARAHIETGDYGTWHRAWIERYEAGAAARLAN